MKVSTQTSTNTTTGNKTFMQRNFAWLTVSFLMLMMLSSTVSWAQITLGTSPYTQNFNSVGSGLPTGWTIRTAASATALGTTNTLTTAAVQWSTVTGQFANEASANSPSTSADVSATQAGRSDRVIGLRQTGAFGDIGAAFVLQIANTTGFTSFNLAFKLMELDPSATVGRTTTWNVDYGFGATPSTFTNATTSPAVITTFLGSGWGTTNVTVNFGSALDNNAGPVWIRIVSKSATTGSGSRPVTAIDDVSLSYSAAGPPSITSSLTDNATVGTAYSYQITATNNPTSYSSSTLPLHGLSINTSTGVISGTPTTAGTDNISITATNNVNSDTKTLVLTIAKGNQTISGVTPSSITKTFGDADYSLGSVTVNSGLTISYSSDDPTVATVNSSGLVHIVGAGSTTIRATQAGNSNWNAAADATQALTVNKANQTITFAALANKTTADADYNLTATASSGLAVTYVSSAPSIATVTTGGLVHIVTFGSTDFTASQAGNANYNAASDVVRTQVITNATLTPQTITFNQPAAVTYGDSPFQLSASASSGLSVSYVSSDPTVASVTTGGMVTVIKPGTTDITASQAGDGTYAAATNVTRTLTVNQKALTVLGAIANNKPYDGNTSAVVDITTTPATLNGVVGADQVTLNGTTGTFATANAGNGIAVTPNLSISNTDAFKYTLTQPSLTANITQLSQTITFPSPNSPAKTFGNAKFRLTATASSGFAVSYSSANTAVATIVGDSVTIVGAGTSVITASQAGDNNYTAAANVDSTLTVNKANQTITFATPAAHITTDADFSLTGTASSTLAVSYSGDNNTIATVSSAGLVHIVGAGTVNITATQAGNTNFNAAANVTRALVITKPVIAQWGFEAVSLATPGAALSVSAGSAAADAGLQTSGSALSGLHATAATIWATSAGNGSTKGISADHWANGDYWQFQANTTGYQNISLVWDQIGSATGPGNFKVQYSTNGTTFNDFAGNTYNTPNNGGAALSWSATTPITTSTLTFDLTAITALNSNATVYFRLVCNSSIAINGGAIGTGGTDRVDNFKVTGIPVQPPVITSATTDNATVGTAYSYQTTVTNGPVTYSSTTTLPLNGLTLNGTTGVISGTPTTAGTTTINITATNSASNDSKNLVITVAKGNQTISGVTPSTITKTYGDADYSLGTVTVNSPLTVTFSSDDPTVATVNGSGLVHIVGAGSTTIRAQQAGDANWNAATDATQALTVNKADQTITFAALANKSSTDPDYNLSASSTSGLAVTFTGSDDNTATVTTGGLVHIVVNGAGSVDFTAAQAGNANYNAASSVTRTQTITNGNLITPVITFNPLSAVTYGDAPFNLNATSNSPVTITYVSSDPTVASISGNTVTILKNGTTNITASQAGDGTTYNAAADVTQSLTVNQKTLTIINAVAHDKPYDGTNSVSVTGATLNGVVGLDDVGFTGTPTFASVNASVSAITVNANYTLTGTTASRYILTQPSLSAFINKANQTITFGALPNKTTADAPFSLTASASSGLTVTYVSGTPAVASIVGALVTINSAGATVITASQAGDGNYNPASDVAQTLTVTQAPTVVTWNFGTTAANAAASGIPSGLTVSNITQGHNNGTTTFITSSTPSTTAPSYTGASGQFNGQAAVLGAGLNTATSTYVEFTLTPTSLKRVRLSNLYGFGSRSTATGPHYYSLRSSLDSYASDLSSPVNASDTMPANSLWGFRTAPSTTTTTSGYGTAVTYRLFFYTGNGTGTVNQANFKMDDLSIGVFVDDAPNCSGTPAAGTASAGTGSFCHTGSTTISTTGNTDPTSNAGISLQWYSSTDNTNFSPVGTLNSTTLPTGTITQTNYYFVQATCSFSGLTSNSDTVTVTISNPAAPTGNASQSFCNAGTVADLTATGSGIQWYAASSGGTALNGTTALVDGTHYYASQTIAGCESVSRFDVTVTINTTTAPTGNASQTFCNAGTVADLTATGSGIQWYAASSGGTALNGTTALVDGTHYFASQTVSGCESATRFDVTAGINAATGAASNLFAVSCFGNTNGGATISLSGSGDLLTGGTYAVDGLPTTSYIGSSFNVSGLGAGAHTLIATSGSCSSSPVFFTIAGPSAALAAVEHDHPITQCHDNSQLISITVSGGTSPYTLCNINNLPANCQGPQAGGEFSFVQPAGVSYTYAVTDANNCATSVTVTTNNPDAVAPTETHTAVTCFGGTSTVTITGVGGTTPYASGTGTFQQAAGTTHAYTVVDAHSCSGTVSVTTAAAPSQIVPTEGHTTIACYSGTSTVTIGASGGTPPYNGTGTFQQAGSTTQTYFITDANECTAQIDVTTAAAPSPLTPFSSPFTASVPCGGSTNISIIGSGGTPPYSGTGSFTQFAGTHVYTVTDANSCSGTVSVTVSTQADITPPNIATCAPNQNATADNSGNATVPDFTANVVASDNCTATNALTITQSPVAGTVVGVGNTDITITVTDASNNSSQCTTHFQVTSGCNFTVSNISGPDLNCGHTTAVGGTAATYMVTTTDATSFNWSVPAGAVGLTGQGTNTITFKYPTTFVSGTVSVDVTSACGDPLVTRSLAVAKAVATPGTISGPLNACPYIGTATQATYSIAAVAHASSYRWTLPTTVTLISATPDSTSITITFNTGFDLGSNKSIKVKSISSCGNSVDKVLAIAVTKPATPGVITGPVNACIYIGTENEATYSIRKVANANAYIWTMPTGATATHPNGSGVNDTLITVSYDNTFAATQDTIKVQSASGCGNSLVKTLIVKRTAPALPGTITGPTNACPLMQSATNPTGTEATYWIRKALNATGYAWSVPGGATITSHPSGTAGSINDTMITVIFDASFIGGAANPISVRSTNSCTNSAPKNLTVSRLVPATPGVITGTTDPCPIVGIATRYSIRKVTNATGYIWNVAGASFTHENAAGIEDTAIFITWAAGSAATSPVSVQATNNCWVSVAKTLTILRKLPATPGAITATAPTACPNRQVTYSLASLPLNATSVSWILPGAASMVSSTTLSITVQYSNGVVSDTIRVIGVNNCANSAQKKLKVSLAACAGFTAGTTNPKSKGQSVAVVAPTVDKMEVKVFPNPSVSDFKLNVKTSGKEDIQVRVLDLSGRALKTLNIMPYETISFGNDLKAGSYMIEVRQGKNVTTQKVIKF